MLFTQKSKVLDRFKFGPNDGAIGKARCTPKLLQIISRAGTLMSVPDLMTIHSLVVGTFYPEPQMSASGEVKGSLKSLAVWMSSPCFLPIYTENVEIFPWIRQHFDLLVSLDANSWDHQCISKGGDMLVVDRPTFNPLSNGIATYKCHFICNPKKVWRPFSSDKFSHCCLLLYKQEHTLYTFLAKMLIIKPSFCSLISQETYDHISIFNNVSWNT